MQAIVAPYLTFFENKISNNLYAENLYINSWLDALDVHDKGVKDHSRRVASITLAFSSEMKFSPDEIFQIYLGALLHDIGKLFISSNILKKPGPLSDQDWVIMRRHPEDAYQLLSKISFLQKSTIIPYYHHEKWGGGGYPLDFKGEEIPIEARLFAIVDVWDSLSYDRSYNKAWPHDKVIAYIQEQAGSHFDPYLVDRFLANEYLYREMSNHLFQEANF